MVIAQLAKIGWTEPDDAGHPNVTSLEHTGAAGGVLHAPILGIEPGVDRCFGPRFGLVAHHHAGAIGPFVALAGANRPLAGIVKSFF